MVAHKHFDVVVAAGDEHHVLAVIGKGGGVRPALAREGVHIGLHVGEVLGGGVVPGLRHLGQYVLIRLVLGYLEEGHYLPAAAALPACGNGLSVAGAARLALFAA